MPVCKAADIMDVYPQRLWNVVSYWIEIAHQADDQSEVTVLGIDETSSKKGHSYVTVAVDMDERRVVYAVPEKGADTIDAIATHLEKKDVSKSRSNKLVSICPLRSYLASCTTLRMPPLHSISFTWSSSLMRL